MQSYDFKNQNIKSIFEINLTKEKRFSLNTSKRELSKMCNFATMIRYILFFLLIFTIQLTNAQQLFPIYADTTDSDIAFTVQVDEVNIVDAKIFANNTERYNYNQKRHYIKMILPYADKAISIFNEIEQATASMNSRAKRKYIKSQEKSIKENFEDKLKNLNITQGKLIIMVVNRQLGINCFSVVKELKSGAKALYYQSWAKLNGIDLNKDYDPLEDKDFENIMKSLGY